ncbi:MAG: efflux RND transporter periplasmic adaptor subunit [Spirochaetia bacterium]
MTGKKISLFQVLVILILLGGAFFLWTEMKKEQEIQAAAVKMPVRIIRPEAGELAKTLTVSGFAESERSVTVLPRVSGSLQEVYVDMGDRVYTGQVIAKIDSEPFALTLRQAEAAYLGAKSTFERTEKLFEAQATSKQNYDQAKSQFEAYESQYELAKLNYSYTEVTSPLDGIVLKKHAGSGELVAPQVPIITAGDLRELVIRAKIPERYYSFFLENRAGIQIKAEVPALDDRVLTGTIKSLSPYIVPETKSFELIVSFSGTKSGLRPGMFIYLTFVLEERRDVLTLPNQALVAGDTLWYVDEATMTAKKTVFKPVFSNENKFQVNAEWDGFLFITEGQHFLRENQEVRIINEDS